MILHLQILGLHLSKSSAPRVNPTNLISSYIYLHYRKCACKILRHIGFGKELSEFERVITGKPCALLSSSLALAPTCRVMFKKAILVDKKAEGWKLVYSISYEEYVSLLYYDVDRTKHARMDMAASTWILIWKNRKFHNFVSNLFNLTLSFMQAYPRRQCTPMALLISTLSLQRI